MKTTFTPDDYAILVYQAGIANVFKYDPRRGEYSRVLQSDFQTCAQYVRGVAACGIQVQAAWCNRAGDIELSRSEWQYDNFDAAPFCESFAQDIIDAGAYLKR